MEYVKIKIESKSYNIANIPKFFRVAFHLKEGAEGLSKGVLDGVIGISGNKNIVTNWLGINRDALLIMPPIETEKLNKLSRIMYDNPYYLLQDNMKALSRIFAQEGIKGKHTEIQNLFNYVLQSYWKKTPKYKEAFYAGEYFGFNQAFAYIYKDTKINSPKDLAKWVVNKGLPELEKDSNYDIKHYVKILQELTLKNWEESIIEGLKYVAEVYGDEGEWLIKDKKLKIPSKSKLLVLKSPLNFDRSKFNKQTNFKYLGKDFEKVYQQYIKKHSPQVTLIKKHGLDKKYKVIYLDEEDFRKIKVRYFNRKYKK